MNKSLITLMFISLTLTVCSPKSENTTGAELTSEDITEEQEINTQATEIPQLQMDSPMQAELIALIQTLESIALKGEKMQVAKQMMIKLVK